MATAIIGFAKDRLNGAQLTLIYNAETALFESNAGRKHKTKSILDIAKSNRSNYGLMWQVGNQEYYDVSPRPGLSFARQIEEGITKKELEQIAEFDVCHLVIPLDKRIYIAEIEGGEVVNESVLVPAKAAEHFFELQQQAAHIYWIDGGIARTNITSLPEETKINTFEVYVKAPKGKRSFEFQYLPFLMLKLRLFHPTQAVIAGPILALVFGGFFMYVNYQAEIAAAAQLAADAAARLAAAQRAKEREQVSTNETDFSASRNLKHFSRDLTHLLYLHGKGSVTIIWDENKVEVKGDVADQYPHKIIEFAKLNGWNFQLESSSWILSKKHKLSQDMRRVGNEDWADVLRGVFLLKRLTYGEFQMGEVKRNTVSGFEAADFDIVIKHSVPEMINRLSDSLENKPFHLKEVQCSLSDWRLDGCQVFLRVKYKI